jgi:hypothetical protein
VSFILFSEIFRLSEDAPNGLACKDSERVALMTEMTQVSLEKAKRHENVHQTVKQVSDFVVATSSIINAMLTAYPPAAIAWSGISAILSVGTPQLHDYYILFECRTWFGDDTVIIWLIPLKNK